MTVLSSFAVDLCRAVITGDLAVIGQIAGVVGGVMLFFFGLPSLSVLSSGSYSQIEPTRQIRLYGWLSRAALLLIIVAFACQLVPAVHPQQRVPMTSVLADEWTAAMALVSAMLWGASACVNASYGFDNDKALNRASRWIRWLNALAASFAAIAALIQAAKPLLVQ